MNKQLGLWLSVSLLMLLCSGCGFQVPQFASSTASLSATATKVPIPATIVPQVSVTPTATKEADISVIVGSINLTQHEVLTEILVEKLEQAGYAVVEKRAFESSQAAREALEGGEIDIYWEESKNVLTTIYDWPVDIQAADTSLDLVRKLDEPEGIVWFAPASFTNAQTLMVRESKAEEGIQTLEQLADMINQDKSSLKLCARADFVTSPDGLPALESEYGFAFEAENVLMMESHRIYEYLRSGRCDVAEGDKTDPRLSAWDFYALTDTQDFFPTTYTAPVVRQATLEQYPSLAEDLTAILGEITPRLDEDQMRYLNVCAIIGADRQPASGDEKELREIATAFLADEELDCLQRRIVIASTQEVEEIWAAKMLVLFLEEQGYEVLDKTALGDSVFVHDAMLNGEVDLHWGSISDALMLFYQISPAAMPIESERAYALIKGLEESSGLIWLKPATNYDVTSTLIAEPSLHTKGIQTIEELADVINTNDASLHLCVTQRFYDHPNGIQGLEDFYGFEFKKYDITFIPESQQPTLWTKLQSGDCDIIVGNSTDNLERWDAVAIEDNKQFFLASTPAPVVRQDILKRDPKLADFVAQITSILVDDSVADLKYRAQVGPDGLFFTGDEESAASIAQSILCEHDLLRDCK